MMPTTDGQFEKALRNAVLVRMEQIVEEETKAAHERVTRRCKEEMPKILCAVNSRFTMERYGRELVIKVQLEDNQQKG